MRFYYAALLAVVGVAGCVAPNPQRFSVFFEPYSAVLDSQALETIRAAADLATSSALPVTVAGFSAPPDPNQDVDGLSAQRAAAVKQMLVNDGVRAERVTTAANGIMDPKSLPNVSVRRVDINVGG